MIEYLLLFGVGPPFRTMSPVPVIGAVDTGHGVPVSDVGVPDTILPLKFYIRLPVGHHIVFSFLLDVGLPISVEAVQHVGRCTIAL